MSDPNASDHATQAAPRSWWIHPFLVAAFPVLFLFSQNIGEQISLQPLGIPLAIVLGGAATILAILVLVGRLLRVAAARAALLASLLVLLALTYGHAWAAFGETLGLHRLLLGAWGLLAVVGAIAFWRLPAATIARFTTAVTAAGGILVIINLVPIGGFALRDIGTSDAGGGQDRTDAGGTAGSGRDVWYLVFDRYAGEPALEQVYDYDNSAFLDELRDRGFVVAEASTASYLKTAHSLASSFNMAELDGNALAEEAAAPDDWTPLYRDVQESYAVERFLHERGYRYLHVGLRRGATYANSEADVSYLFGDTTEFSAVLADTTILVALENVLPDAIVLGTADLYKSGTLFQLDTLDRIAEAPGRNYVFGHLLLPHPPYVFNADGSFTTPEQAAARTLDERYLGQVEFANARILSLLDRLQAGPPESWPIVVLAADEGPFPDRYAADEAGFPWREATDEELLQKFSTLTAVLVPGAEPADLEAAGFSDTITPLNLFRVVFSVAFDADLPPLEDRNWIFTDQRHIYDLVEVTDRVRAVVGQAQTAR